MPKLLAISSDSEPFLSLYDMSAGGVKQIVIAGADRITQKANCVAFSPDGSFLAVAFNASPYLVVYNTSTWEKVVIGTLPSFNAFSVTWSSDGAFLAVGYQTSPYLKVYDTSDWSEVTISSAPSSIVYSAAFSPDGSILVVGVSSSPYIKIYDTSDWSVLSNPSSTPGNIPWSMEFSKDGSMLALAYNSTPGVIVYKTSDWSKYSILTGSGGAGRDVAFSDDGSRLYFAGFNTPYIFIYNTSDWSRLPNPAKLPTGNAYFAVLIRGKSQILIGHSTYPFRTLYNVSDMSEAVDEYPYFCHVSSSPGISDYIEFGERVIEGTVRDIDGFPVARKVRAIRRSDGALSGETVSSAVDGAYSLNVYGGNVEYDVQFMADPMENLNDLFYARSISGA